MQTFETEMKKIKLSEENNVHMNAYIIGIHKLFMLHLGIVKFVLWCIIHATKQNIIIIRTNVMQWKKNLVIG